MNMKQILPGHINSLVILLWQFHWSTSYRRTTPCYTFNYTHYELIDDPSETETFGPYSEVLPLPSNHTGGLMLFNFTALLHVQNWTDVNDQFHPDDSAFQSSSQFNTVWAPQFQRAVLYSWMNPRDNGTGYAGAGLDVHLNLTDYDRLVMYGHAWKSNSGHKMVLYHNGQHNESHPNYHLKFDTKTDDDLMELPLSEFKPNLRGRHAPDAPPLNKANITRLELRVVAGGGGDGKGGYYWDPHLKYGGISRLEIEWIKADKIKKEENGRKNRTNTKNSKKE
uniref:NADH:ubiquinone oxidoreductase intermediate-associated protein 30 domain-containing protein n=1 Tax=Cacopsylla melanoneura TaxID=428564 RepID=A0A8D8PYB8_9HEMI